MDALSEVRDVFAILHDSTIMRYSGDARRLQLTVSCLYLAERINSGFEFFYLDLLNVTDLRLESWLADNNTVTLTDWSDVFASELELATAELIDDEVGLWYNQDFTTTGNYGGQLFLKCTAIKVYDQQHRYLSTDALRQLADDYWRDWERENQR